ncbi:hypothetical protein Tco_1243841 [Tanacetum coccineum]
MSTTRQGISSAKIDQIVSQRVTYAYGEIIPPYIVRPKSNPFRHLLSDIAPPALDPKHTIELTDCKLVGGDTILRSCTLNLVNHPFNIELMLVELGSFDVIVGIDWLSKYRAMNVCDEKFVCIPLGDEILMIQGDRSDSSSKSRLNIISCTKTQKYIQKGCHVFLAQITEMKTEKNSKEKRLEDVPIVYDF